MTHLHLIPHATRLLHVLAGLCLVPHQVLHGLSTRSIQVTSHFNVALLIQGSFHPPGQHGSARQSRMRDRPARLRTGSGSGAYRRSEQRKGQNERLLMHGAFPGE